MTAFLIVGAIFAWILVGLAMITWMVDGTERMFGQNQEDKKVHFKDFFWVKSAADLMWLGIVAFAALFWPILLALTVEAWKEHARKIREEAMYE